MGPSTRVMKRRNGLASDLPDGGEATGNKIKEPKLTDFYCRHQGKTEKIAPELCARNNQPREGSNQQKIRFIYPGPGPRVEAGPAIQPGNW